MAGARESSIAVLAFEDMSPEGDQAHFAESMADAIINALARVDGLRVMARTSSFAFRRRDVTVQEIGERLAVGSVLEGSVQRGGDRVRVTARLISTADGFQRWSKSFDRELSFTGSSWCARGGRGVRPSGCGCAAIPCRSRPIRCRSRPIRCRSRIP
jgi:TolB-like protein